MDKPTCKIDECVKPAATRGLCSSHYNRALERGALDELADPPTWTEPFHRLTDVDLEARTATCSVCGPASKIRVRPGGRRGQCMTKRRQERRGPRPYKYPGKEVWRRRKYGLTAEAFDALMARSGGACELCGAAFDDDERIDHCHETGLVRGLLCNRCNLGLGWFEDDPARLLAAHLYVKAGGKFGRPAA